MAKLFLTAEGIVFVLLLALLVDAVRQRSRATFVIIISGIVLLVLFIFTVRAANARDIGQWNMTPPETRGWFQSLMQPDNPAVSCCGEADAYWADEIHYRDGKAYAVITDDRDDMPLMRKHLDIGTEIEVPNYKLKYDQGNPTGHGVIFLSRGLYPYCFVMPGGV